MNTLTRDETDLQSKIYALEEELAQAKNQLRAQHCDLSQPQSHPHSQPSPQPHLQKNNLSPNPSLHHLLLLSDSALPLGSFAFSSGLESFLAHNTPPAPLPLPHLFTPSFLPLSISSYASTTLPYLLAAHRQPNLLQALDDSLDAATICTVARRASVAQGRALLGIWEKSFIPLTSTSPSDLDDYTAIIKSFANTLRTSKSDPPAVSAHLAPLFGVICLACGLDLSQTAFVFMLNHVKALVSAAVRRGMFGPYQAQKILASGRTRDVIQAVIRREWDTPWEEAGQSVPVMDLWVGRHEMLYSRIFNS